MTNDIIWDALKSLAEYLSEEDTEELDTVAVELTYADDTVHKFGVKVVHDAVAGD